MTNSSNISAKILVENLFEILRKMTNQAIVNQSKIESESESDSTNCCDLLEVESSLTNLKSQFTEDSSCSCIITGIEDQLDYYKKLVSESLSKQIIASVPEDFDRIVADMKAKKDAQG